MKNIAVLLTLCTLLIVSCATEKTEQIPPGVQKKCHKPVWNEGDSWKFTGGGGKQWEETIIRKDNKFDIKQTPHKGFYGILNIPIVGPKIFPLWVGKNYTGTETLRTVEGINLVYIYAFKVVGITDVNVEAGTFECYKIEFKIRPSALPGEEGIAYLYYSPETKSIVKFESKSPLLYKWENYELSSFRPKQ